MVSMKSVVNILKMKYGFLGFGIFCGISYYGIILNLILAATNKAGGLLAFFLTPVIICLPAIWVIKYSKNMIEAGEEGKLSVFMWSHAILFLVSMILIFAGIKGV